MSISRLHQIILHNSNQVLDESIRVVLFLCRISLQTRAELIRKMKSDDKSKPEIVYGIDNEIPPEFVTVVEQLSNSKNAHYKLMVIFAYMLYDPELFGRHMLEGVSAHVQDSFMKYLRQVQTQFITGNKLDGLSFLPGDDLHVRRTGSYVAPVRAMFAAL